MANETSGVAGIDENVRAFLADEIDHATFHARQCAAWDALKANRNEARTLRLLRARVSPGFAAALSDETSPLSKAIAGRGSR